MGFLKSSSRDSGESIGSGFRACPTTYTLQFARAEKYGVLSENPKAIPGLSYWRPGFSGNLPIFLVFCLTDAYLESQ